jgi:hypothetical protein
MKNNLEIVHAIAGIYVFARWPCDFCDGSGAVGRVVCLGDNDFGREHECPYCSCGVVEREDEGPENYERYRRIGAITDDMHEVALIALAKEEDAQ